jgi:hypothetical protein
MDLRTERPGSFRVRAFLISGSSEGGRGSGREHSTLSARREESPEVIEGGASRRGSEQSERRWWSILADYRTANLESVGV